MPIQQLLLQPAPNSLQPAYRPIVYRVQATSSTNQPAPPVVYCDIYVNGIFYKSIARSQYDQLNDINSEWQFDIQDVQEVFSYFLGTNGGGIFLKPSTNFALVFCRFRSSYYDDNNLVVVDGPAPVQATSSTPAVNGGGFTSDTCIILSATLKAEQNQDIATHLNAYKNGVWDAAAYPLTHRPKNYVIGNNSSDYFPFFYGGNRSVRCVKLTLYKKDGTTEVLTHCEPLPPCGITVSQVRIVKGAVATDGQQHYTATFAVNNAADHFTVEVDTGDGWVDITPSSTIDTTNLTIDYVAADVNDVSHNIRITPFCDDTSAGTPGTGSYTKAVCPTVRNLAVFYNARTQQLSYSFTDDNNAVQSVQLWKDSVKDATVRADAATTGSWTITDSGTYYVTVETACSVGDNLTETSNSIVIKIDNPICAAPTNVLVNFSPDGNSLVATWEVADATYSDFIRWYDFDTNTLLLQGLVQAGVYRAVIGATAFPSVQRFYCTVQHQCPSPSILGQSNVVQRNNNFNLSLDFPSPFTTVYVKCTRYGQAAPAPFTAEVNINVTYHIPDTSTGELGPAINTTASNYLLKNDTQDYIMGSSGIVITDASIATVSPTAQGGFSYIF